MDERIKDKTCIIGIQYFARNHNYSYEHHTKNPMTEIKLISAMRVFVLTLTLLLLFCSSCSKRVHVQYPIFLYNQKMTQEYKKEYKKCQITLYDFYALQDTVISKLIYNFTKRSESDSYIMRIDEQLDTCKLIICDCGFKRISMLADSIELGAFMLKAEDIIIFFVKNDTSKKFKKSDEVVLLNPQYVRLSPDMLISYYDVISTLKCSITSSSVNAEKCVIRNKNIEVSHLLNSDNEFP